MHSLIQVIYHLSEASCHNIFNSKNTTPTTVKVERANITAFMDCEPKICKLCCEYVFGSQFRVFWFSYKYLRSKWGISSTHHLIQTQSPTKGTDIFRRPFACTFPFVSRCWYIPFVWFTHLCVEHAIEIGFRLSCTNAQKYLSLEANSGKQTQKLSEKKQVKEHSQWASNVSRTMCVIRLYYEHMQCTWTNSYRIASYHEYECGTSVATSFVSTPNIHAFADKTVLLYTVWIQLWFVCRWARIVLAQRLNIKVCSILPIFSRTNYLYGTDFHHLFIRCVFLFLKKRINSDYFFSPTKKSWIFNSINLVNWIKSKRVSLDKKLFIFFSGGIKNFRHLLDSNVKLCEFIEGKTWFTMFYIIILRIFWIASICNRFVQWFFVVLWLVYVSNVSKFSNKIIREYRLECLFILSASTWYKIFYGFPIWTKISNNWSKVKHSIAYRRLGNYTFYHMKLWNQLD